MKPYYKDRNQLEIKFGRYMTSTGWIICHGYSTPKKSNEIISLEEANCKKYEKEDVR